MDRTWRALVHGDSYVRITVYLHIIQSIISLENTCYVTISLNHGSSSTIMILHELESFQSKANCLFPDRCMSYIVNNFEQICGGSQVNKFELIQGGSLCEQGPFVVTWPSLSLVNRLTDTQLKTLPSYNFVGGR